MSNWVITPDGLLLNLEAMADILIKKINGGQSTVSAYTGSGVCLVLFKGPESECTAFRERLVNFLQAERL
jgi:hypothetical protein